MVTDVMKLAPEIRDQVYNPSVDGLVDDLDLQVMEPPKPPVEIEEDI
jgi:hypothetical protein